MSVLLTQIFMTAVVIFIITKLSRGYVGFWGALIPSAVIALTLYGIIFL